MKNRKSPSAKGLPKKSKRIGPRQRSLSTKIISKITLLNINNLIYKHIFIICNFKKIIPKGDGRMKLAKMKEQVTDILHHHPQARDDDKLLQVLLLKKFYNVKVIDDLLDKKIPSLESITRCRRKIQSEGLYVGTKTTQQVRAEEETVYREFALTT